MPASRKVRKGREEAASESGNVNSERMRTQPLFERSLEQAIEEGIESGPAEIADSGWWKGLDAELEKSHGRPWPSREPILPRFFHRAD